MVVSVKETKANPYYILREENRDGFLEPSKQGEFSEGKIARRYGSLMVQFMLLMFVVCLRKNFQILKRWLSTLWMQRHL